MDFEMTMATSFRIPLALRSQLETLRYNRASRGMKLARWQDLVLEALLALVERETTSPATATGVVR